MVTNRDVSANPTNLEELAVWRCEWKAGFSTPQDHPHFRMILTALEMTMEIEYRNDRGN
jgi:hypothetical protein